MRRGVTGFTKFTGGLKKFFRVYGEKKFLKGPVNPVNLVTGEPDPRIWRAVFLKKNRISRLYLQTAGNIFPVPPGRESRS